MSSRYGVPKYRLAPSDKTGSAFTLPVRAVADLPDDIAALMQC
jgi:hypothetical protein